MRYAVDRIENGIVVLENILNNELREVDASTLPSSIHEGSILVFVNNTYIEDTKIESERRMDIYERFKRLRDNT